MVLVSLRVVAAGCLVLGYCYWVEFCSVVSPGVSRRRACGPRFSAPLVRFLFPAHGCLVVSVRLAAWVSGCPPSCSFVVDFGWYGFLRV